MATVIATLSVGRVSRGRNLPMRATKAGWRSTRRAAASGASPASRSNAATTSHECRACSLSRKAASVAMSIGSGRKGSDGAEPGELGVVEGFERLDESPVGDGELGRHLPWRHGVPAGPHLLEGRPRGRALSATAPSVSRPISAPLPRCDSTWATVQSVHIDGRPSASSSRLATWATSRSCEARSTAIQRRGSVSMTSFLARGDYRDAVEDFLRLSSIHAREP